MRSIRLLVVVAVTVLIGLASCAPRTVWSPRANGVWYNSSGKLVHWNRNRFPLVIALDNSISFVDFLHMNIAMEHWNTQVGADVFVFDAERPADIYFEKTDLPDVNEEVQLQGLASLQEFNGEVINCHIRLDVATSMEDATVVLVHELGHCLGLTHDSWPGSVMFPHAAESGKQILQDDLEFVRWQRVGILNQK